MPFSRATRCSIFALHADAVSIAHRAPRTARGAGDTHLRFFVLFVASARAPSVHAPPAFPRRRTGPRTVYPDVPAVLEPLDQHLQAVLRELVAQARRLGVLVAEVLRRVVLAVAASDAASFVLRGRSGRKHVRHSALPCA